MQIVRKNSSKTDFDATLQASITDILETAKVPESKFFGSADTFVFMTDEGLTVGWKKDVCGQRMVILGSAPENIWASTSMNSLIQRTAIDEACDLIQHIVEEQNNEKCELVVPDGGFITNFVFEKKINSSTEAQVTSTDSLKIIEPTEAFFREAGMLEFYTRWSNPGSTYFRGDTIAGLNAEYDMYQGWMSDGFLKIGVLEERPDAGFIIWIESESCEAATIAFIWVSPSFRGQGIGHRLLAASESLLRAASFKSMDYFVSVQNFSALKMLKQSGFILHSRVVNQLL